MEVTAQDFLDKAEGIIAERYPDLNLKAIRPKRILFPIEMPGGYRMPLDIYLDGVRIRGVMLILFHKTGSSDIQVEWNDLEQRPETLEKLRTKRETNRDRRITINQLEAYLHEHYKKPLRQRKLRVTFYEEVWSDVEYNGKYRMCWRLSMVNAWEQSFNTLIYDDGKQLRLNWLQARAHRAVPRWKLGYISCREAHFSIRIAKRILEAQKILEERGVWTIWSCFVSLRDFLAALGYKKFDLYDIDIRQNNQNTDVAKTTCVNGIPQIRFYVGPDVAWSTDVSVVLHELGHALMMLLFVRPPSNIIGNDDEDHVVEGIEEGFCDYLAAAVLKGNGNNHWFGSAIALQLKNADTTKAKQDIKTLGLPRSVTTRALKKDTELKGDELKYYLGQRWSHLLWDYRSRALKAQNSESAINEVILSAHLCPLVDTVLDTKQPAFHS